MSQLYIGSATTLSDNMDYVYRGIKAPTPPEAQYFLVLNCFALLYVCFLFVHIFICLFYLFVCINILLGTIGDDTEFCM